MLLNTRAVYKNYIHKQGSPYRHKKKGGGGSFCFYFLFRYLCLFFLLYQFILLEKNNDNVTGRTGPLGSLCIGCLFFGGRVSDVMKLGLFILFFIWNMWFYTMNLKDRREKMLRIKYSCEMHKKSFSILKLEKKKNTRLIDFKSWKMCKMTLIFTSYENISLETFLFKCTYNRIGNNVVV